MTTTNKQMEIKQLKKLQHEVRQLWITEGAVKLKKDFKTSNIQHPIFRFPDESRFSFGDFGIKKEFFVEYLDKELIEDLDLEEKDGIIVIPTN